MLCPAAYILLQDCLILSPATGKIVSWHLSVHFPFLAEVRHLTPGHAPPPGKQHPMTGWCGSIRPGLLTPIWATLKGHPSSRAPRGVSWSPCCLPGSPASPSAQPCFLVLPPQCCSAEHALINFPHANLHPSVCFLEDPTCDTHISKMQKLRFREIKWLPHHGPETARPKSEVLVLLLTSNVVLFTWFKILPSVPSSLKWVSCDLTHRVIASYLMKTCRPKHLAQCLPEHRHPTIRVFSWSTAGAALEGCSLTLLYSC